MPEVYERVTRFFMNAVDPYQLSDAPPHRKVWPYLKSHLWPLRRILVASVIVTSLAASVEVWLIQYAGTVIDILASSSPRQLWETQGTGLLAAALVVLLFRPFGQSLRHAVNDISFQCNAATLVRWRAYDHLVRQSVGWFQEDLTGRTSGRLVDIGNHVADSIHSALNAVAFGIVYMAGVVVLMAGIGVWLAVHLLVWLGLYLGVLIWIIPRMVVAQQNFQSAKSALIGSVVDSFSNFDPLKLFAPTDQIAREQRLRLEATRQALFRTRQIGVSLRTTVVTLEAVAMVGFIGYGIWLWSVEAATIGLVASGIALSLRITTMADWILDSVWWVFSGSGHCERR